ncbi:MAG TPA: zeta toxin family protein [Steroidobacteraceae bacterium]|nr:zeta toxin family protein [Steroidobacteraceae bacterium]
MSLRATPSLVILTGASGAGKTALAAAVRQQQIHGCRVLHFDSIGIPTQLPQSRHEDQPGRTWQRENTLLWMARVAAILNAGMSVLFEGQMRIAFIEEALLGAGISNARILLLDCDDTTRTSRLAVTRSQPHLATTDMMNWGRYLRREATAAGHEILDTDKLPFDGCLRRLQSYLIK